MKRAAALAFFAATLLDATTGRSVGSVRVGIVGHPVAAATSTGHPAACRYSGPGCPPPPQLALGWLSPACAPA